ncbi:MAG: lysostaphin resistance A-like protein [Omnitrophica WOR_2 bacterium]
MVQFRPKLAALAEVLSVFGLMMLVIWILQIPPFSVWMLQTLRYRFLEYILMMGIPIIILILLRRDFTAYGLNLTNLGYHLQVAGIGFLPFLLISLGLNRFNWMAWQGSLYVSGIEVLALVFLAWVLRRQPAAAMAGVVAALWLWAPGHVPPAQVFLPGRILLSFVFYFFFAGPGEEIFYRGYIQSRLNQAFGKPYTFFGVNLGWGLVIAALLFSLMHTLNTFNPLLGRFTLSFPWGLWTFFLALLFGFLREKTRSVAASSILHGVLNFF